MTALLEIDGLRTHIRQRRGLVRAVDGVSLHVEPGETLGLVGESGCGKSMTAMSILRLLPPGGFITEGSVRFEGTDLVKLHEDDMRQVRGNDNPDHAGHLSLLMVERGLVADRPVGCARRAEPA